MGKVVDGVELLRMVRDEELKEETKLRDIIDGEIYVVTGTTDGIIREDENGTFLNDYGIMDTLICAKFEILSEEKEEIDIDSIKELDARIGPNLQDAKASKINDLIKAVKQLNKKLEEK